MIFRPIALITLLFVAPVLHSQEGVASDSRSAQLQALQLEIDARYKQLNIPKPIVLSLSTSGQYHSYVNACFVQVVRYSSKHPDPSINGAFSDSATIAMVIRRDGSLERTFLIQSTGNENLIRYATTSIFHAAPFEPLPKSVPHANDSITIVATFRVAAGSRLLFV